MQSVRMTKGFDYRPPGTNNMVFYEKGQIYHKVPSHIVEAMKADDAFRDLTPEETQAAIEAGELREGDADETEADAAQDEEG